MTKTRALVVGGGGFLGSHLIRHLLSTQPEWSLYSASRNPSTHPDQEEQVEYLACDIANKTQVVSLFDRVQPNVVFHVARPHHLASRHAQISMNVEGTRKLLETATACSATMAFVFAGSDYGLIPNQDPISEDEAVLYTREHPSNPYGTAKGIAEALVIEANSKDLATVVLRVPGLYGVQDYNNLVPVFLSMIKKGQHKYQIGEDDRVYEMLYVRKAAEAHVLAAKALLQPDDGRPPVAGEVFFISDGIPIRHWAFCRQCFAAAGSPVAPDEVQKIPLGIAQSMASVLEWAYFIFTLGYLFPKKFNRQHMDHFERGTIWKLDKAEERLGYVPVTQEERDAAIRAKMEWGKLNLNV